MPQETLTADIRLKSGKLPLAMLYYSKLSTQGRLLYGVLSAEAERGKKFPSKATLARMMGCSIETKKSVQKWLIELVCQGFLDVTTGKGKGKNNRYYLTAPAWMFLPQHQMQEGAELASKQPYTGSWEPAKREAQQARQKGKKGGFRRKSPHSLALGGSLPSLPGPSDGVGLASPTPYQGSASPTPTAGQPYISSLNAFELQGEGERPAFPSTENKQSPPPQSFTNQTAPLGWEGYAEAYKKTHPRRPFSWHSENVALAQSIFELAGLDPETVRYAWKKYLNRRDDKYWYNKGNPLMGLFKQFDDYLPIGPGPKLNCDQASPRPAELNLENFPTVNVQELQQAVSILGHLRLDHLLPYLPSPATA